MKFRFPDVVEKGRVKTSTYASNHGDTYGAFVLKAPSGIYLRLLVADGDTKGWLASGFALPSFDHVSVSVEGLQRCPTWDEMNWVKGLFWNDDECVIQYHPPASEYVNHHPYCLHLWKPIGVEIPLPPRRTMA